MYGFEAINLLIEVNVVVSFGKAKQLEETENLCSRCKFYVM